MITHEAEAACWVWHLCVTLCTPRARPQTVALSPSWSLHKEQQEHTQTEGNPAWRIALEENLRRLRAFQDLAGQAAVIIRGCLTLTVGYISSLNGAHFKR